MEIRRVAVLGAGVMGAGIAAHVANAGVPVLLLDLPGGEGENRNAPAERGLSAVRTADPAAFMHDRASRLVEVGNFEDDLASLSECDWIVEAVVERLDVKRSLYERIDTVRGDDAIVSSNTSTIPLSRLTEGLPERFRRSFLITHFFNPPRYMRLLELVTGPDTDPRRAEAIARFCDEGLGKGVVRAKDTPGFIANRIGAMWLGLGVAAAVEDGITVEQADAVLGRPFGIPKTGVFGLLDLVGLDLMPHIQASMAQLLPASDPVVNIPPPPEFLSHLVQDGYTGRKGKGGFYRLNREEGQRVKEALDLQTGTYRVSRRARPACLEALRSGGLRAMLSVDEPVARYALRVMSRTLAYAAALLPEIADSPEEIDEAMRLGFRWERGPFELIDELEASWLCERLADQGEPIPSFLQTAREHGFYESGPGPRRQLGLDGQFRPIPREAGTLSLGEIKRSRGPEAGNASASVWDIGEEVLCLEFHSKMNALDAQVIEMLGRALEMVKAGRRGLVIYNEGENFSVGANAGLILFASNLAMWDAVEFGLKAGQDTYKAMKYSPFPVVGAPSGMALGGGCEILLHCDAVQAHAETYMGLVEVGVGLLPGWGGCKEMILRWMAHDQRPGGPMPAIQKAFELISLATVARSAAEARDHLFLLPRDRITMNRDRLLADARSRVVEMSDGYTAPTPVDAALPGASARAALSLAVESFRALGLASAHDAVVAGEVARVVTGGDTDVSEIVTEDDLFALERTGFSRLLRTAATAERLTHMLETGKPLRN